MFSLMLLKVRAACSSRSPAYVNVFPSPVMIQGFGGVLVAVSSSNRVMILIGSSEPASATVASAHVL